MSELPKVSGLMVAASVRDPMCIEFFGLPGSGKTTIAREVYAALSRARPGTMFAPEFLRDEAGLAARAAVKLRLILANLGRGGLNFDIVGKAIGIRQARFRDKLRAVSAVATVMSLYATIQRRGLGAVLDQGVLQALWSVQLRATDGNGGALIADMLKGAVSDGRVHVLVETPPEVCMARLGARASKHSRMQNTDAARDQRAWETAELLRRTLLGSLRAAYRKQGTAPWMIVVDGTADPVETASRIVAELLRATSENVAVQSDRFREAKA